MEKPKVFNMAFSALYPIYVQKAEKKGRTQGEVDTVIHWLFGYDKAALTQAISAEVTLEAFVENAPQLNPNAHLITGVVCGVRVENITEPTMQKVRYLDKLVDELAKGKKMEGILRHG